MVNEKKKKVLLIDDDEIHLITAELFLKNDYEVYKMKSGSEALEYLTSNKLVPNIILLDIVMPNMSGWEVFVKIKAIDSLKNVPIVFLSSITEEEEKKRAYKMGIAGFITKPFNMTDLISEIKEVIRKSEIKK
ncbi:MAG: response regulator [Treponema sp.]|jgi:putative two-component system response regulator|nr:response regulator [Treponema sp.]